MNMEQAVDIHLDSCRSEWVDATDWVQQLKIRGRRQRAVIMPAQIENVDESKRRKTFTDRAGFCLPSPPSRTQSCKNKTKNSSEIFLAERTVFCTISALRVKNNCIAMHTYDTVAQSVEYCWHLPIHMQWPMPSPIYQRGFFVRTFDIARCIRRIRDDDKTLKYHRSTLSKRASMQSLMHVLRIQPASQPTKQTYSCNGANEETFKMPSITHLSEKKKWRRCIQII